MLLYLAIKFRHVKVGAVPVAALELFNYVWCEFGSFCRSGLGCWAAAAAAMLFMPELLTGLPLNHINFDLKYVPYEAVIVSQTVVFLRTFGLPHSPKVVVYNLDLLECSLPTNGSTKNKIWDKFYMLKDKVKLIIEKEFNITQEHLIIYNYNRICFPCGWIKCIYFGTGFYFLFS